MRQQPPERHPLHRIDLVEQLLAAITRQLGQQVGGVVGRHLLDHVGGPGQIELGQQLDLIALGELLEDVGQRVVAQRADQRGPLVDRQRRRSRGPRRTGASGGCRRSRVGQRSGVEEPRRPRASRPPATAHRTPSRPPWRSATVATTQARARWSERRRPMSRMVSPPSTRPSRSVASSSSGRARNWPRSTRPVTIWMPRASTQPIRDADDEDLPPVHRAGEPEHRRRVVGVGQRSEHDVGDRTDGLAVGIEQPQPQQP